MRDKQELISELTEAINAGIISRDEIRQLVGPAQLAEVGDAAPGSNESGVKIKLSAIDVMFYVSGVVLFAAILSIITQTWYGGPSPIHIVMSAGVGLTLWAAAYYLINSSTQSEIKRGLVNALLLTGSLLVVVGGYIAVNILVDGFAEFNFIPVSVMLLIVSALHVVFDRLVKKDLIMLMGVLLGVTAFPTFMFGLLQDVSAPMEAWMTILVFTAGLLAYATRVVSKAQPDRQRSSAFDSLAAFVGLSAMLIASFGDYDFIWFIVLTLSILAIFYLSVISRNRHLLGQASIFLVVTIITISFRYFSGLGVSFSLIMATIGLLGTAAIAANLNKKYFK